MASSSNLVQSLKWNGRFLFVGLGPGRSDYRLLLLTFAEGDSEPILAIKRAMAQMLLRSAIMRRTVTVTYTDGGSEIQAVDVEAPAFAPMGEAIHGDLFTIGGNGFAAGVQIQFNWSGGGLTFSPDVVRPHLLVVESLPTGIPTGILECRLANGGWSSDPVYVHVRGGPRYTVRTLYSGEPGRTQYAIVLVANSAIESAAGGTFTPDPILTNRAGFQDIVRHALENLLMVTEPVLRDRETRLRFVAVFDPQRPTTVDAALCREATPNLMAPQRSRFAPFLASYLVEADMAFAVHGSTVFDRATAWYTTDDMNRETVGFTYDGITRRHGRYTQVPGTATLAVGMAQNGLTVLHEFGHAASEWDSGRINDLYVDGSALGAEVNKKFRALPTDAIPAAFATVDAIAYTADSLRDRIGYPNTWTSYHPELIDTTRPNLMDNYWLASSNIQNCRLDRLTAAWLGNRLDIKMNRR